MKREMIETKVILELEDSTKEKIELAVEKFNKKLQEHINADWSPESATKVLIQNNKIVIHRDMKEEKEIFGARLLLKIGNIDEQEIQEALAEFNKESNISKEWKAEGEAKVIITETGMFLIYRDLVLP